MVSKGRLVALWDIVVGWVWELASRGGSSYDAVLQCTASVQRSACSGLLSPPSRGFLIVAVGSPFSSFCRARSSEKPCSVSLPLSYWFLVVLLGSSFRSPLGVPCVLFIVEIQVGKSFVFTHLFFSFPITLVVILLGPSLVCVSLSPPPSVIVSGNVVGGGTLLLCQLRGFPLYFRCCLQR